MNAWVEIIKGPHCGRRPSWLIIVKQVASKIPSFLNIVLPERSVITTLYCVKLARLQSVEEEKQISPDVKFVSTFTDARVTVYTNAHRKNYAMYPKK